MSDPLIRTLYFNPLQSNQPSCHSPQPLIQIEDLLKTFLKIQVQGTAGECNVIRMQLEVRCSEGEDEPNNFVSTSTRKNLNAFIYLNTERTPNTILVAAVASALCRRCALYLHHSTSAPQDPPPPHLRCRAARPMSAPDSRRGSPPTPMQPVPIADRWQQGWFRWERDLKPQLSFGFGWSTATL